MSGSRLLTISLPEDTAAQVETLAVKEHREVGEILHDAFVAYRLERAQEKIERGRANARARRSDAPDESEIESIVDEIRSRRNSPTSPVSNKL